MTAMAQLTPPARRTTQPVADRAGSEGVRSPHWLPPALAAIVALAIAALQPTVGWASALRCGGSLDASAPFLEHSAGDAPRMVLAAGDLDGDGLDDLLHGYPHDDANDMGLAIGMIAVGDPVGMEYGFSGAGGNDVQSGWAVAIGDFDGNGVDDAAYSAPGVRSDGLVLLWTREFEAGSWPSQLANSTTQDRYGEALAAGDFDGDGYDDLAVGFPEAGVFPPGGTTALPRAGTVHVLHGGPAGLDRLVPYQRYFLDRRIHGLGGVQANEACGAALAVGDFDDDGIDDLAVGAPFRSAGGSQSGEVVVFFGNTAGLDSAELARVDSTDVFGTAQSGARFGAALAIGNFDQTFGCLVSFCFADLAIGAPGLDLPGGQDQGAVAVVPADSQGLRPDQSYWFTQEQLDGAGALSETGDRFGSVLHAAELDARPGVDLAIGVPEEDVGGSVDQGVVHVVFGGAGGLNTARGAVTLSNDRGVFAPAEPGDRFGTAVTSGRFRTGGPRDLAVAVPLGGPDLDVERRVEWLLNVPGCLFADDFENGNTSAWLPIPP